MFFKLLKLAGLDVNAKIAELKAELAFKAEQASEHVTHKARALAMVAGLFWCAGIMALLALIVGLAALYKWGEIPTAYSPASAWWQASWSHSPPSWCS